MKNNVNKLLLQYVDKWVAVDSDYTHIFASGDSIPEVEKKLKNTKENPDKLVITYINSPNKFLSPHGKVNL